MHAVQHIRLPALATAHDAQQAKVDDDKYIRETRTSCYFA